MAILVKNETLWGLLQSDENDKLDFKSSTLLTEPDGENRYKISKHMVAFANHRGGKIVFGVDDQKEPEGAGLIEEQCLGTISEIVSSRCSPSVTFSHEFYSSDRGDLSEGSVLVLNIDQRTSLPPVAIVESRDGKIRKREYRIRAGDSTRLVSDGELVTLFEGSPDLETEMESRVVYTHSDEFTPVEIQPTPSYQYNLNSIYHMVNQGEEELHDLITNDDGDDEIHEVSSDLFQRIFLMAILSDLYTLPHAHASEEMSGRIEEEGVEPEFEFEIFGPDLINYEKDQDDDHIISELPVSVEDVLENRKESTYIPDVDKMGFWLPESSALTVSEDFSSMTISLEDQFELLIDIQWFSTRTGLPQDHPESNHDRRMGGSDVDNSKISVYTTLDIQVDYTYPRQDYSEYITSREFVEQFIRRIEERYDWDSFIDSIPNKKLYQIEDLLKDIESRID
ncbi:helix-turn-helix domain-containing protein [Halorubrum xinjiangense]|uniref:AlbA family DNA-binding domain-containing protein n=1 Tax=Halorubrum xinjiangense TaxID=261291 RepID=UPI003C6F846A